MKKGMFKHGFSQTGTYRSWHATKCRCTRPTDRCFYLYGGRGVSICKEWADFLVLLEDMGERPNGKTLDRIDSDGNYNKDNCRWATNEEQANNQRTSHIISHRGESLSMAQWSRKLGGNNELVACRLRSGWSEERAVTEPLNKK